MCVCVLMVVNQFVNIPELHLQRTPKLPQRRGERDSEKDRERERDSEKDRERERLRKTER